MDKKTIYIVGGVLVGGVAIYALYEMFFAVKPATVTSTTTAAPSALSQAETSLISSVSNALSGDDEYVGLGNPAYTTMG